MALTESTMLPLRTKAPEFSLIDVVSGKQISLETFADRQALLIIFLCQHCPFVRHIKPELTKLSKDFANTELGIVAISANDITTHPDDSPDHLKKMAIDLHLSFPICYDATQEIAKSYTAACTPDFFLFDRSRQLVYRGQLDDSRPSNGLPITGKDLREAIDAVLAGKEVSPLQKPSIGCNIKWKRGNEPAYYG